MMLYDGYARTSDADDRRNVAWVDYAVLLVALGVYGALLFACFLSCLSS